MSTFDPSKFGAVPVTTSSGFDPTKFGAVPAQQTPPPLANTPNMNNALFRSSPQDNPLVAGGKAIANLPSSFFNLGKGILTVAQHPIDTGAGILRGIAGATEQGLNTAFGKNVSDVNTQTFDTIKNVFVDRYGSLEKMQKTATEDPAGFGADVLSIIEGGAGLLGKTEAVNNAISKTAQIVTKPAATATNFAVDATKSTGKFLASQATGLNPETISQVIKNPEAFKNVNPELRVETANQVKGAIDARLTDLSESGKGYQAIREAPGIVTIKPGSVGDVLNKYGIKLDENNQIIKSNESRPLSTADRASLQDFINTYVTGKGTISNNAFLNTREALSKLSNFELGSGKTDVSTAVARDLRNVYDEAGKAQVKGLNELDSAYAPEKQLLKNLQKDMFTPTGDLKDGAISKIANITGKGKEALLERVKQVVPDIEQRVNVLKAVEDIQKANGLKVGTYGRSIVLGGELLTGNIPTAIVTAILTHPEIAVQILKGAGYVGKAVVPIIETLKSIANDINNFRIPKVLQDEQGNLKMGLSIQDVSKIHPEDFGELRDFTDYVAGVYKPSNTQLITDARRIAVRHGIISPEEAKTIGDRALSSKITKSGMFKKKT